MPTNRFQIITRVIASALVAIALIPIKNVQAAGIVVNTAADVMNGDADCSLREAIIAANTNTAYNGCAAGSGADTITFAENYTITLNGSQLPQVISPISILGNGVENTIIQANTSPNTATYRVLEVKPSGILSLDGVSIQYGRCNGSCETDANAGGGIYSQGQLSISNSRISENTAGVAGGGICSSMAFLLSITNTTVTKNIAGNDGGGIFNTGISLSIDTSIFSENSAATGGGINSMWSDVSIADSFIRANSASNEGGGLYFSTMSSTIEMSGSTIAGNTAVNKGGGVYISGSATLTNNTISGNSATQTGQPGNGLGGGIYNTYNSLTLRNNTLSENSAAQLGGGLYNTSFLYYSNTIIANSSGGDCYSSTAENVHNLVEDGSCSASLSGDPNLGSLVYNGGWTPTHALLDGSPAIDQGDAALCPLTDQRGVTRPVGGGCDIGAFEAFSNFTFLPGIFRR